MKHTLVYIAVLMALSLGAALLSRVLERTPLRPFVACLFLICGLAVQFGSVLLSYRRASAIPVVPEALLLMGIVAAHTPILLPGPSLGFQPDSLGLKLLDSLLIAMLDAVAILACVAARGAGGKGTQGRPPGEPTATATTVSAERK